jgi:glycosidase
MWSTTLLLPSEPTLLTYHFVLKDGAIIREKRQFEGVTTPPFGEWEEKDFRIAVFDPQGMPPAWVRGQVMYQIFPDRFAIGDPNSLHKKSGPVYGREPIYNAWGDTPEHPPKSRDFFGGDLRGVINQLDYLRDLGVTTIYFTPIFESPSNHRYDASDYFKVDARLGTEDDLRELVTAAEARGMRVMLDAVLNHCSSESDMFKQAQADKTSPWYRRFEFTEWPAYAGWLNVKSMPEFVECPETEDFFFGPNGVTKHWLKTGIAGFRTDVTPWITDTMWRRFFKAMRAAKPDIYLIAEDWGDNTSRFTGDQFDAAMNYRFAYTVVGWANAQLTPSELDDRLETLRRDTPETIFHIQMNLLTSHDTPRLLNLVGFDKARLKMAVALQMAYPGVPMVYYGEEAGCTQQHPECESGRVSFPWDRMDADVHAFFRTAIAARLNSQALSQGSVETIWVDDAQHTYGFAREHAGERVLALFNNGAADADIALAIEGTWRDLLGQLSDVSATAGMLRITLPAKSAAWLAPT